MTERWSEATAPWTWIQIHAHPRELARLHAGRDPTPSAAARPLSRASRSRPCWAECAATTATSRLVGRKRHILVDTEGLLLSVVVHAASMPDRKGGQRVLEAAGAGGSFPRLQHIWADQGYTGTLVRWVAQQHGWTAQVVYPQFRQLKRYAPELLSDYPAPYHALRPSILGSSAHPLRAITLYGTLVLIHSVHLNN